MHAQYTWCSRDPLLNPEEKPHWDKAQPWLADTWLHKLPGSIFKQVWCFACLSLFLVKRLFQD